MNLSQLKINAPKHFKAGAVIATRKRQLTPCTKTRHTTYRSWRSISPVFCTAHCRDSLYFTVCIKTRL